MVTGAVAAPTLELPEDAFTAVEVPKSPQSLATTANRRRKWARHALAAATSLGALGGFLAITRAMKSKRANAFDAAVMRGVASIRNRFLNGAARDVTGLGGVTVVSLTAATALVLARRSPLAMLQLGLGSLGGVATELALKKHFARPRPELVPRLQEVSSWSYPSGHAIATSCLYLSAAFVGSHRLERPGARVAALTTGATLAGVVGATRVYLGVHYPTDVLGGLALGTAWACLLEAVFDYVGARAIDQRRRERLSAMRGDRQATRAALINAAGT